MAILASHSSPHSGSGIRVEVRLMQVAIPIIHRARRPPGRSDMRVQPDGSH